MSSGAFDVIELSQNDEKEVETILEFRVARAQSLLEEQLDTLQKRASEIHKEKAETKERAAQSLERSKGLFSQVASHVWTSIPLHHLDVNFTLDERSHFMHYVLDTRLCFGRRSEVFKIVGAKDNTVQECCKFFHKNSIRSVADMDRLSNELKALQQFQSEWVPALLECCQTRFFFCMRMEYAGSGCLLQYLKHPERVQGHEGKVVEGLRAGLSYIHSHGCVHREVMPENVVVRGNYDVSIVGFASALWPKDPAWINLPTRSVSPYLAPEEQLGEKTRADPTIITPSINYFGADVWSAAIVALETLLGLKVLRQIIEKFESSRNIWAWHQEAEVQLFKLEQIPLSMRQNIASSMKVNPSERLQLSEWVSTTPESIQTVIDQAENNSSGGMSASFEA